MVLVAVVMRELEQVHEIADRRAIFGRIAAAIVVTMNRIREIVAAERGHPQKVPVLLDELQDRYMIIVGVIDVALLVQRKPSVVKLMSFTVLSTALALLETITPWAFREWISTSSRA
jgi:hypothetical protein